MNTFIINKIIRRFMNNKSFEDEVIELKAQRYNYVFVPKRYLDKYKEVEKKYGKEKINGTEWNYLYGYMNPLYRCCTSKPKHISHNKRH